MQRCLMCTIGSWVVGLCALGVGIWGVFDINLIGTVLGERTPLVRLVGGLIALTALLYLAAQIRPCPYCQKKSSGDTIRNCGR